MKSKLKIEVLYPELCNLHGDLGNVRYLKECLKDEKFYYTNILDKPHFSKNKVDLIYLGSMSEKSQELVVGALKPYKEKIETLIKKGTIFIITGNAFELFGKYIEEDKKKYECLDIFEFYTIREMFNRKNSLCLGTFDKIDIVGFKSHFTQSYGDSNNSFIKVKRGYGLNTKVTNEGIKYNNFYATSLLGPFLVLNPRFTKYILNLLGINKKLPLEKEIMDAYNERLKEFKDLNKKVM